MLKEEGFSNVVARHRRLACGVRHAVQGWGLKVSGRLRACACQCLRAARCMWPRCLPASCLRRPRAAAAQTLCKNDRWKSDSLTVVETPEGIDSNKVRGGAGWGWDRTQATMIAAAAGAAPRQWPRDLARPLLAAARR